MLCFIQGREYRGKTARYSLPWSKLSFESKIWEFFIVWMGMENWRKAYHGSKATGFFLSRNRDVQIEPPIPRHPCLSHPLLGKKCGGSHTNYAVFVRITPKTKRISRLLTAGSRINATNDHFWTDRDPGSKSIAISDGSPKRIEIGKTFERITKQFYLYWSSKLQNCVCQLCWTLIFMRAKFMP